MRPGLPPHTSFTRSHLLSLLATAAASVSIVFSGQLWAELPLPPAQELIATPLKTSKSTSQPPIRLERILLLLQATDKQQSDLNSLLEAQTTPGDPRFHQWLTLQEFATRFAPTKVNAATVEHWLTAQGFSVAPLPQSRQWIEFSGTSLQLEKAFGVGIIPIAADPTRYQLSSSIHLPASIAPLVKGFASLDGALATAASTPPILLTATVDSLNTAKAQPLIPETAATLLHLPALSDAAAQANGAGETIVLPARTNVRSEDFTAFRKAFTLPEGELAIQLNGPDPGRTGEESAILQAASWASVAAPAAKILLVAAATTNATDGLDLALAAAIDQGSAHTISIGYSSCEPAISPAHQAFYAALYKQAAAEGVAILATTGDSGAAACHSPSDASPIHTGLAVNALAATPWNTAIGAASFSAERISRASTALLPWHSDKSNAQSSAYATGGGASALYPTPKWQSVAAPLSAPALVRSGSENALEPAFAPDFESGLITANPKSETTTRVSHQRYLPDISLPAASDGTADSGLAYCFSGDSATATCRLVTSGGSAASAAIFAGIAATLAQKYGPQGNLAPNLYALEPRDTASSKIFQDITTGSAQLACELESPGCSSSGLIGFNAAPGYDLATGLGSIDALTLVAQWATPADVGTATATVEMTTVGGVTYNPSATVVLTAKVISGSGGTVPTGTVQFYDQTTSAKTGTAVTLSAAGIATYSETGQFTSGGHNIQALYSGDATYAAAESQPVTINIQPSATSLKVTPSTTTPTGGSTLTVTAVVTAANAGATPPTGLITVNLDGIAQGTGTLGTTGSATVSITVPASGSHTVQATYAGDSNYNNSTSPSVTITVSKVASVTTLTATPTTITTGVTETLTATLAPATAEATAVLTGTVAFYDGTTLLGTSVVAGNTAVLTGITLSQTATHSITAVYSGDATYSTSTSTPVVLSSTLAPVTVTLTADTAVLAPGRAVTLTAVVTPVNIPPLTAEQHPSGFVLFYAGNVLVGTQAPVVESTGDSSVATTFVSSLPAGAYVLTAVYSGDPTYGTATSNSLNLQVQDFSVTCSSTNISMTQGSTQSVPCAVASLGGLTGAIQVICEEQNPPTLGAITCTFNPSLVTGNGTSDLSIVTTAGNLSPNHTPPSSVARGGAPAGPGSRPGFKPWQAVGGGIALAFACLLLSPIGRRARHLRPSRVLALVLLLAGMAASGIGCTNSVTLTNNSGTPLGVHTLKITAAAAVGTVTVSHYTYLTVNVTP